MTRERSQGPMVRIINTPLSCDFIRHPFIEPRKALCSDEAFELIQDLLDQIDSLQARLREAEKKP